MLLMMLYIYFLHCDKVLLIGIAAVFLVLPDLFEKLVGLSLVSGLLLRTAGFFFSSGVRDYRQYSLCLPTHGGLARRSWPGLLIKYEDKRSPARRTVKPGFHYLS